ncbi:SDR family oxidoreductase [Xenophilus arseniciresistens]|uniref:SDR family oxidoreductase n=1 Tax=Xenophilus arseniciresistens TaxID=1283306 RepID=A0AAE3NCK4_9BURK|nr:SDR family oxidoreductase [Xenophilus arseniciresistens]MDA7417089.1 SDR family oxidoreductase [Xenophilus arseniciresistens]
MDYGISQKTALVLSAGGGLGRAIAIALAQEGAQVALADVDGEALAASKEAVQAAGGRAFALLWDLGDVAGAPAYVHKVQEALGGIDILINNTGGPPPTPAAGQSAALWRKHFDAMVLSVIATTDAVLPGMRERGWGRIVTSASSGVVAPIPNLGLSNALRLSLVGWSKTLAREVARQGITANVVLPGRVATDRIRALDEAKARREGRSVQAVEEESTGSIPAGRYGRPAEYADAVAFLASERASYINGSVLRVDGGLIPSV